MGPVADSPPPLPCCARPAPAVDGQCIIWMNLLADELVALFHALGHALGVSQVSHQSIWHGPGREAGGRAPRVRIRVEWTTGGDQDSGRLASVNIKARIETI